MRLPRPYVPLDARIKAAERECNKYRLWRDAIPPSNMTKRQRLNLALRFLFDDQKVELNHDPALCNRSLVCLSGGRRKMRVAMPPGTKVFNWSFMKFLDYDPPANDPDYLVYMPVGDHDIRTRVRGAHGQYSDLALARKRKRKERKMVRSLLRFGSPSRKAKRPKRRWPSRPLRSRNDLRKRKGRAGGRYRGL